MSNTISMKLFLLLTICVVICFTGYSPPPRCYDPRPTRNPSCGPSKKYYYYNARKGRCSSFFYNGCGGSRNVFKERSECQQACACYQELKEGYHCGKKYSIRYYWDSESRLCRKFWYSGCGGNHNRFQSKKLCKKVCRGW